METYGKEMKRRKRGRGGGKGNRELVTEAQE